MRSSTLNLNAFYLSPHVELTVVEATVATCFSSMNSLRIIVTTIPIIIPGRRKNDLGTFGEKVAPYAIVKASIYKKIIILHKDMRLDIKAKKRTKKRIIPVSHQDQRSSGLYFLHALSTMMIVYTGSIMRNIQNHQDPESPPIAQRRVIIAAMIGPRVIEKKLRMRSIKEGDTIIGIVCSTIFLFARYP